jgi:hypothetical protein
MPKSVQIPGRFRYRADAIPKGHRVARRILMHAPVLYEIWAVDRGDIKHDAVRVRTYASEEVSYSLYDGRLWRPANPANPVSIEDYARMAQAWPTMAETVNPAFQTQNPDPRKLAQRTDPIAFSHDFRDDLQWPSRGDLALHAEEDFQGRLVRSDKLRAQPRYLAAAAHHVLLVDREIYFAAPEPLWDAGYDGVVRLVAPRAGMTYHDYYSLKDTDTRVLQGWRTFAADRRDDALSFATQIDSDKPHPVEGELLELDPDYMPPPVLSRAVQECFYWVFQSGCENLLRYMSPTSFGALVALKSAAASLSTHGLGELERDPSVLVAGLRSIKADLEEAVIPEEKLRDRRYLLTAIEPVLQRADFEAALKPKLTEEDERSLSAAL